MLYSFKLTTSALEKQIPFKVHDGERTFTYYAGKGREEHFYCNLIVDNRPQIETTFNCEITELSAGENQYMTPTQEKLNSDFTKKGNLIYRISVRGTPNKAIVTCPQYAGDFGPVAPYPVLSAERFDIDNTLLISIQDPYFSHGSYLLSDNYGNPVIPAAVSMIKRELEKYNLLDQNVTFVGASKGANIAALLSKNFNDNQLILCAYAVDLDFWIRNTGLAHIGHFLDSLGVSIPDSHKILIDESERKETHWFYSTKDPLSNRGLEETIEGKYLTKYPCAHDHGSVLLNQWDTIRELIIKREIN